MSENKFNPFQAKELEFVTYGGLKLNKQKGYSNTPREDSYHQPPAPHGIYAFVWPYVERFLLGGNSFVNPKLRGKGQRNRIKYVKDKDGNVITNDHPEYEKYSEKPKNWSMSDDDATTDDIADPSWKLYQNHNRKKFKYSGPIWHHLGEHVKDYEVLAKHGTWVKTEMKSYISALKKELHNMGKMSMSMAKGKPLQSYGHRATTRDHLEVFIDEKI